MSAGYNNPQAEYEQQSFGYDIGSGSTGFQNTDVSFSGTGPSSSSSIPSKTSFFSSSSQSKYEDLKQMLESSKEVSKLEAMKRIITMVAKGRSADSARELFPHVVKNVVTKNSELKKLVYLYLVRYAEQEQDLALLSIATFQHSLKDPNPLIRGSAIRVLSSIRVPMIAPIVLIAIKDCANDMSPYVRKIAAHAIPKLYSLDPDIKDDIVEIIAKLLHDKVPLVLGSVVAAFEEVCPERIDLIHENYRKLCALMVDVDEWGQIIIINMLMRYSRSQFLDPNRCPPPGITETVVDADHLLLLRSCKPLLQSRNSGVVLSVIQLYLAIAPQFELSPQIVRPLIRLLHSYREIQLVILKSIVTLTSQEFNDRSFGVSTAQNLVNGTNGNGNETSATENVETKNDNKHQKKNYNDDDDDEDDEEDESGDDEDDNVKPYKPKAKTIKSLFEPFLKSFFVKSKDSTQTKILKLEILTNLSNSGNISLILREFQAYIMNYQDEIEFMTATIDSIGQCASRIKEIAPICLNGLVSLLSNRNETIVAQSIVVIRSQIINKEPAVVSLIIRQIVRLMDKIMAPQARATILWIVAEFCSRNEYSKKIAPDVLRKIAKSFCTENDLVKLQALNLAAKLSLTSVPEDSSYERLKVLVGYVFNLAKYDTNYDVRDRGRFLKHLLNDLELAKRILLVPKMVPLLGQGNTSVGQLEGVGGGGNFLAPSSDSIRYRVGTLSHFVGKKASDYEELPDWPEVQPNPEARRPKIIEKPAPPVGKVVPVKKNGFITDSDDESEEDEDDDEEDDDEEEDEEDESGESESGEESDDESEEDDDDEEEDEDEEEEEDDDEDGDEVSEEEPVLVDKKKNKPESNIDLLLGIGDMKLTDSGSSTNPDASADVLLPTNVSENSSTSVSPAPVVDSAIDKAEATPTTDKLPA